MGVLLTHLINDCLDNLVALTLLLEGNPGLIFSDGWLELVGGNFLVARRHRLRLLTLKVDPILLQLLRQHLQLSLSILLSLVLILVLFAVNVIGYVANFASSLLNGRIELHRVLSCVLQGLLQVGDLAGQFSLT